MQNGGGGRSFEDRLAALVRDVVDDVRQKVVEEPWFGRPVTEKLSDIHQCLDNGLAEGRGQEMDRFYGQAAPEIKAPEPAEPQHQPEHHHGIDR